MEKDRILKIQRNWLKKKISLDEFIQYFENKFGNIYENIYNKILKKKIIMREIQPLTLITIAEPKDAIFQSKLYF